MKRNWLALMMTAIIMFSSFSVTAAAEGQSYIQWGEVKEVTYDGLLDTILMYRDELHDGGIKLLTGELTRSSKEADLVINKYGDKGGLQVTELPKEKLEDPTPDIDYMLSTGAGAKKNKCYLIVLQDGSRAKIRIDQITNTKAFLSYVLETAAEDQPMQQTPPTPSIPQKRIELTLDSRIALVDGNVVLLDTAPKLIDGRTMVPLRFIIEALGAKVDWNGSEYRITITQGSDKLVLWVGIMNSQVNGTPILLDVAPQIINDTTLVPVRFISESLKQIVDYDMNTRKITVKSNDGTKRSPESQPEQPAEPPVQQQPNQEPKQPERKPAQGDSKLEPLFGIWQLIVPGVVIVTPDYFSGYDKVESKVGALAGSIAINSDGTYIWNSSWDKKVIHGTWEVNTGDNYPMVLRKGESGSDWKVTMMKDGLTLWDGDWMVKKGSKIE